jgi:pimeloyl-ACP methyl ester carboxylesterase
VNTTTPALWNFRGDGGQNPGVRFKVLEGMGHFPFAENPKRFAEYLLPILTELKG